MKSPDSKFMVVITLVAFSLLGCQSKPSIIGKWDIQSNDPTTKSPQTEGQIEFKSDKTYIMEIGSAESAFRLTGTFTYTKENSIVMTVSKAEFAGERPSIPGSEEIYSLMDQALKAIEGRTHTGNYKFISKDEMTLSLIGETGPIPGSNSLEEMKLTRSDL